MKIIYSILIIISVSNISSQTFEEHIVSLFALDAFYVDAADIDGDGDMDLMSASRFDDKISWYENNDTNYVSVVFETQLDDGVLGEKLYSPYELSIPTCTYENTNKQWSDYWSNNACTPDPQIENEVECCSLSGGIWQEPSVLYSSCDFSGTNQWCLDDEKGFLIVSLPLSDDYNIDPNNANVYGDVSNKRGMGLAYPWAVRPALNKRKSFNTYDIYKYGNDQ